MIYGYARVSTYGQDKNGNSLEAQEKALKAAGADKIYIDSITGTKMDRPQFEKLLAELKKGDTFLVTKLDRFARTVSQASDLITKMIDNGITVNVLNLGVLSNDSVSVLIRNILLSFAQFERDMIVERTQEGKAIARTKEGFKEGRPKAKDAQQRNHVVEFLKTHTYKEASHTFGISKSTLIRYKKEAEAKQGA